MRKKGVKSFQTNEEWIEALTNPVNEDALQQLRKMLVRGLKPALHKYVDRELDQFVEDVAQDALVKILDNIQSFRGESKLITWAMKIAVREGLNELRRKRYDDISIEDLKPGDGGREIFSLLYSSNEKSPDRSFHEAQLMQAVKKFIEEDLSDKQRTAIQAVIIKGLPPSVVVKQMNTNRNALYKVIHDARLKLKTRFELEGINTDEMLQKM